MDLLLLIGQSNAKGCGNPELSVKPKDGTYEYVENFTGNACIALGVTLQLSEGRGTVAPALANTLMQRNGREIAIVHYAVDGSRIKNWNHDKWQYLTLAIEKFQNAVSYLNKTHKIERKMAVWIQGESDAKYGTDPIYYKQQLLGIGKRLKEECQIEKTFVSATGYWMENQDSNIRSERISVIQDVACQESKELLLVSKMALSFPSRNLLQDQVHYNMNALNLLGEEIANQIDLYYNEGNVNTPDTKVDLTNAKEYIKKLELL